MEKRLTELDCYYFHQGTNFSSYNFLGCNLIKKTEDKFVYFFRTWAPNAISVGVVGDFCSWDEAIPMERITEKGVFECIYESSISLDGMLYKYSIRTYDGRSLLKGDPYAKMSRGYDDGASVVCIDSSFGWSDDKWLSFRDKKSKGKYLSKPLNIYEVHLPSFLRNDKDNSVLNYRELADILAPYVKSMGFTHIELLPIAEYPYGGSWGYQVGAFFAPTSRHGTPDDFRYFINKMHNTGIGIIIDWVPAHFPKDEWGLYEFDGKPLYEYQGIDRMESHSWGTRFFDLGREEVQSFLVSCALYYFREFHVDGLRVDAVASMLYLDYDRMPGEWNPNPDGSNINLEAVAFFQKLNTAVFKEFDGALMIAEESGAHGGITKPVSLGGLGFNLKWNMGFANDFYDYMSSAPDTRKNKHTALNFPIMYAFSENYVLPISHDEVVHGKKSFIDKMHGDYQDKFKEARAALMLFMTYPGKKLMFMGTEFAQFSEWKYNESLEWFMLDYPNHYNFRLYAKSLANFYLSRPELWEDDFTEDGFSWIYSDENEKNLVAFKRNDLSGNSIICVINFSPLLQKITLPLIKSKYLDLLFATEPGIFPQRTEVIFDGCNYSASIGIQGYSGVILKETKYKKQIKL